MTGFSDARMRQILDPLPEHWPHEDAAMGAAVLAPLITRHGIDYLLFTERHADLAEHAGQISFPGGMREAGESPQACALREAEEEIALPASAIELLGALSPRPSRTGFAVQVMVARVSAAVRFRPDPIEVERIIEVPMRELLDRERWIWPPAASPDGSTHPPCFPIGGKYLWGLTGRFTLDLIERLSRAAPHPPCPPDHGPC